MQNPILRRCFNVLCFIGSNIEPLQTRVDTMASRDSIHGCGPIFLKKSKKEDRCHWCAVRCLAYRLVIGEVTHQFSEVLVYEHVALGPTRHSGLAIVA